MKKSPSIHTIARELNVSATTISLIVNGKARKNRISDDLVLKIEAYLKKINYRPSILAKSLRTGKTNIVGMVVEDISDPFFSTIGRGVEIGLEESGYLIMFMSTKNNPDNAISIINILKEYKVDGFIIAPSPGVGIKNEIEKILISGKPVVLFDRYCNDLQTCNIMVDNYDGVVMGITELYQNGYRSTGFVTLVSDQVQMVERLQGYKKTIEGYGQMSNYVLKVPYNLDVQETVVLIEEFLKEYKQIDSLLFATNYLAIAGLHALNNAGYMVGKNFGVVGFDDNTNFSLFSPSVTAVAQPVSEISDEIVKNILPALKRTTTCFPHTIQLKTKLLKRDSSLKFIMNNS